MFYNIKMAAPNINPDKPIFEGKPIFELPKVVPIVGFLTDSYGEDIFREAQDRARTKYRNAGSLQFAQYKRGVVKGSNPFYAVLIDEITREGSQRLRTATPADIERTLRAGDVLKIKGNHYIDTGLVLRSETDSYNPNDPLSRDLFAQLKKRQGRKLKLSVMIPLCDLDLRLDPNNQYGLGFTLREDAEIIHAPVLNKQGRFNTEDIDPKTGLPNKTGDEGERQFYTRERGLSRLDLGRGLDLDSNWKYLDSSDADGRVAVCGEVARENLELIIRT